MKIQEIRIGDYEHSFPGTYPTEASITRAIVSHWRDFVDGVYRDKGIYGLIRFVIQLINEKQNNDESEDYMYELKFLIGKFVETTYEYKLEEEDEHREGTLEYLRDIALDEYEVLLDALAVYLHRLLPLEL
jgi:hypothetical protein